jgi:hypothetical protein
MIFCRLLYNWLCNRVCCYIIKFVMNIWFQRNSSSSSEMISNFIPAIRFNVITTSVVLLALVIGILLPDIEIVLEIVSSGWADSTKMFLLDVIVKFHLKKGYYPTRTPLLTMFVLVGAGHSNDTWHFIGTFLTPPPFPFDIFLF